MPPSTKLETPDLDTEKFRLRNFVDTLVQSGEAEIHDAPIALLGLAARLDGNPKAVLFRNAGAAGAEVVGNVLGSRERVARAFGVAPQDLAAEIATRLNAPQPVVKISSDQAPVHQVVRTSDDADFTSLPVHLQHGFDGGPYISAGIDHVIDPETGRTNVGSRRLMLRGRQEAGIDLVAPSDLRGIYQNCVDRGERLPISFVLGSHPVDFAAAAFRIPGDELSLIGALRGAPLAVVKCVTNDIYVPADAEIVLEGYVDENGWSEAEGPYGEFFGYYGVIKHNPVFHLTAIAMRRDALFQTVTISGRHLAHTETAQIDTVRTEIMVRRALDVAVREPVAVYATAASNGSNHVRISLRQTTPGEARNAIAAAFGCLADIKHVFVMDDDIDVFSDQQVEWALATRFQADRDLVVAPGFRVVPLDPSPDGSHAGAKAGFDLTVPFGKLGSRAFTIPAPPEAGEARFESVAEALSSEAMAFGELAVAVGSADGLDVVRALDELRTAGRLSRLDDGEYALDQTDE